MGENRGDGSGRIGRRRAARAGVAAIGRVDEGGELRRRQRHARRSEKYSVMARLKLPSSSTRAVHDRHMVEVAVLEGWTSTGCGMIWPSDDDPADVGAVAARSARRALRSARRSGCAGIWRWPSPCPSRSRLQRRKSCPSSPRTTAARSLYSSTPLSQIARSNRPAASGDMTLRWPCSDAPADWPPTVTLFLSPPNFAILRLHPFQRELLVEDAIIAEQMAFAVQRGMRQEAHQVQAIVDGDDDGLAVGGELARVIVVALAIDIAAAVDPEDDRQLAPTG